MPRVMALRTIQQQSSKSSVVGRNNETYNYFSSAMSSGGRCGGGTCPSSTYVILWYLCGLCLTFCNRLSPAIIYFPPGYGNINFDQLESILLFSDSTYIVSSPITTYYFTEMVGDARNPPTIKATAGFSGIAVIGR